MALPLTNCKLRMHVHGSAEKLHSRLAASDITCTFLDTPNRAVDHRYVGSQLPPRTLNVLHCIKSNWQHQVLQLEACLISLSQGILICPLCFAREVAIAQSHNPQECCHPSNCCSKLSGQVEEVCRPSCTTPCSVQHPAQYA